MGLCRPYADAFMKGMLMPFSVRAGGQIRPANLAGAVPGQVQPAATGSFLQSVIAAYASFSQRFQYGTPRWMIGVQPPMRSE